MLYDVIIVGGGMAGLYTAYNLPKTLRILILEKYTLGGKVDTYQDAAMTVEAGAARFSKKHVHLLHLLHELNLSSKIKKIPSGDTTFLSTKGLQTAHLKGLWDKLKTKHKRKPVDQTLGDYARSMMTQDDYDLLVGSFGYSAEFDIMNAADAVRLMEEYSQQFHVLSGGLSQMVHRLVRALKHVDVKKEKAVNVQYDYPDQQFIVTSANGEIYEGKTCVMAVPRTALEKFTLFRPLKEKLRYIKTSPLCRIYAECAPGAFPEKITTDNDVRFVIPITKDVVLASYSDAKYANRWKRVYDLGGVREVAKKLKTGLDEIGVPSALKHIKFFYWPEGVGYWALGANSLALEKELLRPYKDMPLFVCGENYSHSHQQWMEGALDTAKKTADSLLAFIHNLKT